jgi:hypothetical protein
MVRFGVFDVNASLWRCRWEYSPWFYMDTSCITAVLKIKWL